jgi:dolichol-phosphate mannosyltransferase
VYNEEIIIPELTDVLKSLEDSIQKTFQSQVKLEFIFIDNFSVDNTITKLLEMKQGIRSEMKIYQHPTNLGFQNSILTGLRMSQGNAAAILQADLQDPPELLNVMIENWLKGHKYVATKMNSRKSSYIDRISRLLGYLLLKLFSSTKIQINSGDFWLIDRSVINQIIVINPKFPFFRILLPTLKSKDLVLKYDRVRRVKGESKFDFFSKYEFFIDALLSDLRRFLLINMTFYIISLIIMPFFLFVFGWNEQSFSFLAIIFIFAVCGTGMNVVLVLELVRRLYGQRNYNLDLAIEPQEFK